MTGKYVAAIAFFSTLVGGCTTAHIAGIKPVNTFAAENASAASGYEEGKTQLKAGNPALAIEAFRRDLSTHGASAKDLNGLAIAFQALGRMDVAESYLEQAFALDPKSVETAHNLSLAKYQEGAFNQAVRFSSLARELAVESNRSGSTEAGMLQAVSANAARVEAAALASQEQMAVSTPPLEHAGVSLWTLNVDQRASSLDPHPVPTVETQALPAPRQLPGASTEKPVSAPRSDWVPSAPRLRIVNAVGRNHMASRMAIYLKAEGVSVNGLANAKRYAWGRTEIRYKAGYREAALKLAKTLPVQVKLIEASGTRSEIEFQLGGDLVSFDRTLKTV